MRSPHAVIAVALLLVPGTAHAMNPDPALAFFTGAGINLAGFLVGGALLATSHSDAAANNAGWATIEGGFALAPLGAHAVVNEWGRGFAFAATPTGVLVATGGIFATDPGAVERGSLPEQRWMWGLFGVGLFASAVGVVDAMFAPQRARTVYVQPSIGAGRFGVAVGGAL